MPRALFVLCHHVASEGEPGTNFEGVEGSLLGKAPTCPTCGVYVGGIPLLPPARIELERYGAHWGDAVFGAGGQILVSDRLLVLAMASGLRGLDDVSRVEVVRITPWPGPDNDPPKYHLLNIPRSQNVVDDIASGLVMEDEWDCDDCRSGLIKRIAHLVLDHDQSADEDIFYARGLPGTIIVSAAFQRMCEQNSMKNCRFVPAAEYSFDFYPGKP